MQSDPKMLKKVKELEGIIEAEREKAANLSQSLANLSEALESSEGDFDYFKCNFDELKASIKTACGDA